MPSTSRCHLLFRQPQCHHPREHRQGSGQQRQGSGQQHHLRPGQQFRQQRESVRPLGSLRQEALERLEQGRRLGSEQEHPQRGEPHQQQERTRVWALVQHQWG